VKELLVLKGKPPTLFVPLLWPALFVALYPTAVARGGNRGEQKITVAAANTSCWLDVNRFRLRLNRVGGLDLTDYEQSSWNGWDVQGEPPVYDQGLWITGKRNGLVGCLPYIWYSPYSPGPVINGRPALEVTPGDESKYRAYLVTAGDRPEWNPDVGSWPRDLGAPCDSTGQPRVLGDQIAWMVYNGLDSTLPHWPPTFFQSTLPHTLLPVEVHQTAFAHFGDSRDTSLWASTVFFEWSIYNRGTDPLDSVYLSLWTDLDFIRSDQNLPGVDTIAQTGYCWYAQDSSYASVGYTLLFGPTVSSPGSTAVSFGTTRQNQRNLPLSGFWGINDDSHPDSSDYGPPYSLGTAWNVVRGLNQRGEPIIDPSSGKPTRFPYSGDPITRTGYVYPWHYVGGGAGFMMTTGPCTIAPGDSQWIMIALIPSVKRGGTDAINLMRANAAYLRHLPYDSLIARKPRRSSPVGLLPVFNIPSSYSLHANYPNPFNGATTIPFDLPELSHVRLEVFDLLGRSVTSLLDQIVERGSRGVTWFPSCSSGIYFIRMRAESLESTRTWRGSIRVVLVR
jgi:hypothetical protein